MKVLVCGGRKFAFVSDHKTYLDTPEVREAQKQYEFLLATLDKLVHVSEDEIIEGGASGADTAARMWARYHGVPCTTYKADWDLHGKAAGVVRNIQMLREGNPDLVIAFPGGRGTAHMVRIAREAGVDVIEVEYAPQV